jgi:hypothetical protein
MALRRRLDGGRTGGGRRRPGAAHCAGGRALEAEQGSSDVGRKKGEE